MGPDWAKGASTASMRRRRRQGQAGRFRAPVQFRRVSGAEVLSQSQFEIPLSRIVSGADPAAPGQPGETVAQAEAVA